ncbi:hypothetical protein [Kurthia sibirica]|uniref:HTH cro/C1-type domain-containing protein n=1 Tax=Kurthia sibirica TaxID=202750 RepID=A0A2U3AGP7_9BACL|nr:hypothetical protein [Kurthia sibirica]PWI23728.1 hypothetical protein DEX24_15655 [Kurthia sibirica]GEK35505.1 hypothetical protein KSI01_30380 [Kurthia sibirica]
MNENLWLEVKNIPERLMLKEEYCSIALYQEAEIYFQKYKIDELWKKNIETNDNPFITSESFSKLSEIIFQTVLKDKIPTKKFIKEAFDDYIDTILYEVEPLIIKEEQLLGKVITNETTQMSVEQVFGDVLENERIFTSFNSKYNMVRDTVSSKKSFIEQQDGILRSEIVDPKGVLAGKAELRLTNVEIPKGDEAEIWFTLVHSTINAFSELTADLMDIISHMWLVQEKDEDGYIDFDSDTVLKILNEDTPDKPFVIRERDRFKIMKHVAALSSVWLSMREDNIKVVNPASISDEEEYDFTTFRRMFDIDNVKIAYHKKTGEPKGVYGLKIKPTPILRKYFDTSLQTFVPIDLKIIQYSYTTQRELKRLGRYLSYQWKVRTLSRTLHQAFKVKTLLEVIDFPASYNGSVLRERFENTLDALMKDQIIKEWYYKEPIDETRVGKRDWVRKYWGELNLMIIPPSETIEINKQKISAPNLVGVEKETYQKTQLGSELSPQNVELLIDELKLGIRKAAKEIGISHNTVTRYINNEAQRTNKSVLAKLELWYKANVQTRN